MFGSCMTLAYCAHNGCANYYVSDEASINLARLAAVMDDGWERAPDGQRILCPYHRQHARQAAAA